MFNPPDGYSNEISLRIVNPVPVLEKIEPAAVPAGTAASYKLLVTGSGFSNQISATANGIDPVKIWGVQDWGTMWITPDYSKIGVQSIVLTNPTVSFDPFSGDKLGGGSSAAFNVTTYPVPSYSRTKIGDGVAVRVYANGRYVLEWDIKNVTLIDTCLGVEDSCVPGSVVTPYTYHSSDQIYTDDSGRFFAISYAEPYPTSHPTSPVMHWDSTIYDNCFGAGQDCQPTSYSLGYVWAMSGNARRIVFTSNYVVPDTIYIGETCIAAEGSCTRTQEPVSVGPNGELLTADAPVTSPNGRFVAFRSTSPNLIQPPAESSEQSFVYLRDTCYQAPAGCNPANSLVTTNDIPIAVDSTGRFVRGSSLYDTCRDTPDCYPSKLEINPDTPIPPEAASLYPERSLDGRFTAFTSLDNKLVPDDTNGKMDAFLYDNCVGATDCAKQTRRYSVSDSGIQSCGDFAAITPDAQYLFSSSQHYCEWGIFRVRREEVLP